MIIIAVVLLIALVGIGVFVVTRMQGTTNTAQEVAASPMPQAVPGEEVPEQVAVREITVEGRDYSFAPASINVTQGERVRVMFINRGAMPHDFVIDELGVATRIINPGQTDVVEFTASDSGSFTYYCSVGNHRALGMVGSLSVE